MSEAKCGTALVIDADPHVTSLMRAMRCAFIDINVKGSTPLGMRRACIACNIHGRGKTMKGASHA
jgi:hypothetical protein